MAKLTRKLNSTSQILQVFIQNAEQSNGSGLTGLTNSSPGLSCYYHRDVDLPETAISLVSMTVGSFTSGGFKEISSSNMPGWYQLCPPNACFSSGTSVGITLSGASGMVPVNIEIDLDARVASIFETMPELTSIADAPATPTLAQAAMLLYMALRNDMNSTATKRTIKNNAGTPVMSGTMADDGTTFSQGLLS